jgi:flagellar export protein FliJ
MARKRPLLTLQRLAQYSADVAARGVGERLGALRAEEERLRQVQDFLDHYEQMSVTGATGLTVGGMLARRRFAARLRDAADRQGHVVTDQEFHYRAQIERWRIARADALALQRFNERTRSRELDRRDRREQARLDEIGQRRR